jgi:hypothetical protein
MPVYKVQAPDGSIMQIEGPADATDAELQQVAEKNFKPGAAEIGRVVDKAFRGGLTALPGMAGDAVLAAMRDDKALEAMGPFGVLMRATKAIPGVADTVNRTKFGDVTKTIQTAGGVAPPLSEPQSSMGKAVANVAEPVVSTMAGGGAGTMGQKAAMGFGAGLGGEGAARLFGDNVLTRLLGSILGGGTVGVAQALKPNASTLVQRSTEHMTDADWKKAKLLEATLNKNKDLGAEIPHLKSQLLGDRSTLSDVVAVANTNPSAGPKLRTAVADAAPRAKAAFSTWQDEHLPTVTGERREILNDIQQAAKTAIDHARQRSNDAYRAQMPPHDLTYSPDSVKAVRQQLLDLAKSPKFGETTDGGKAIARLADDLLLPGEGLDLSKVNPVLLGRAKKAGTDLSTLPGAVPAREPVTSAHQINNLIKDLNQKVTKDPVNYKGLPVEDVKAILKAFTVEFDSARAAKSAIITGEVNPMMKGLAGDIASMGGGVKPTRYTAKDTALDMVFPDAKAQPNEILKLEKAIGADGVGTLLREYFTRAAGKAFGKDSPELMTSQPFKFSKAITGTDAQQANIDAALHIVSKANGVNPAAARVGFKRLIDAFDSFDRLNLPGQIDRASLGQEAGKNAASLIVAPNSRIGRFWNEKMMTKTYSEIADLVTSQDGLRKLEAIAKSPKQSTAQQLAVSILTAAQAGETKAD